MGWGKIKNRKVKNMRFKVIWNAQEDGIKIFYAQTLAIDFGDVVVLDGNARIPQAWIESITLI
jgi:hypothetical protein